MGNFKFEMPKRFLARAVAGWLLCMWFSLPALAGGEFLAIAYHDVVDHRSELTFDAVTLDHLIDHLEWLKSSGYHPISIDDLEAAQAGVRVLPDRAVLLCWDDGYTSFYTRVLPLLKAYHFPAVLALVGSWMQPGPNEMVQYGDRRVARKKFMTWQQVREAAASGLVEIASHSYNLHTTVLADAAGDKLPAAVAHQFYPESETYETDEQFRRRIREDLRANSNLIRQHLGFRPRVLVWPFGRYNEAAREIAVKTGLPITLTLDPVPGDIHHLEAIGRVYPTLNPDLMTFRSYLDLHIRPPVTHFFRIDGKNLLEPAKGGERNFGIFLDRVKDLNPNMVIIDPMVKVAGGYRALFMNHRFPVAQDRLMRYCWHTDKRAGTEVFLWLSPDLFTAGPAESSADVIRFFSDMGKSAPGAGLVVNASGLLPALMQMSGANQKPETGISFWNPDRRRQARQVLVRSGQFLKAAEIFRDLEAFQQWQPFQEVGLVVNAAQFRRLATRQVAMLLRFFDFLVIRAGRCSADTVKRMFGPQIKKLHASNYLQKCTFLFSVQDRRSSLARELPRLANLDIINWGYAFDHFLHGNPNPEDIRPLLSKRVFPYPLHR